MILQTGKKVFPVFLLFYGHHLPNTGRSDIVYP